MLDCSIISADSRQCYKYLNIGTSTPALQELCQATHYNISVLDPAEDDSAVKFGDRALGWQVKELASNKHILYAGGSTLHLTHLIKPLDDTPSANHANVKHLTERIETEGVDTLYEHLEIVDPEYARNMEGRNPQRIIRALDVFMQTGKPFSSFHTSIRDITPDKETLVIGLSRPRKELYHRINHRVDKMISKGLVREVEAILALGYSPDSNSLNTVGYKEIIGHLRGRHSLERAVTDIKTSTRRYAKRQLTWFRRWNFIHWFDLSTMEQSAITHQVAAMVEEHPNIG